MYMNTSMYVYLCSTYTFTIQIVVGCEQLDSGYVVSLLMCEKLSLNSTFFQVYTFCDDDDHNIAAPNDQNDYCGKVSASRSVWSVMRSTPDFKNGKIHLIYSQCRQCIAYGKVRMYIRTHKYIIYKWCMTNCSCITYSFMLRLQQSSDTAIHCSTNKYNDTINGLIHK